MGRFRCLFRASSVGAISVGDTVDSRYTYTITGSDGSAGNVYFIATNGDSNYGSLVVSDIPLDPSVTYTFGTFNTDGAVPYASTVQCFGRGTQIETDRGLIMIEDLAVGDNVRTMDHGSQPIRWIGSQTVSALDNHAPILFRAGAIGNKKDLVVSPQHRMLLTDWRLDMLFAEEQVLAPAKSLINGHSIVRQPCEEVEYFHLLFDTHEIIFSEGIPSESFHPRKQSMDSFLVGGMMTITDHP